MHIGGKSRKVCVINIVKPLVTGIQGLPGVRMTKSSQHMEQSFHQDGQ
jgi:hypothetical protein